MRPGIKNSAKAWNVRLALPRRCLSNIKAALLGSLVRGHVLGNLSYSARITCCS